MQMQVAANYQKYLKLFANEYLKFTCMSNWYSPAMKIFTKIMKLPFFTAQDAGLHRFFLTVTLMKYV